MIVVACPSCGAEVRFASAALPVSVCEFCRSLVVQGRENLRLAGTVAVVPPDLSPLQLGAQVWAQETEFALVGRIRWRWTAGAWTEWFATSADGGQLWLGEAMGRYMALGELTKIHPRWTTTLRVNDQVQMQSEDYRVSDVKVATCVGAEGQLPYPPKPGQTLHNTDLTGAGGRCASIQTLGARTQAFVGRFQDLEGLRPRGLRALPGWPAPEFAHG